jgi:hypothetical protein
MFILLNLVATLKAMDTNIVEEHKNIAQLSAQYKELVLMEKEEGDMKLFLSEEKRIKNEAKVDEIRQDTLTTTNTNIFVYFFCKIDINATNGRITLQVNSR